MKPIRDPPVRPREEIIISTEPIDNTDHILEYCAEADRRNKMPGRHPCLSYRNAEDKREAEEKEKARGDFKFTTPSEIKARVEAEDLSLFDPLCEEIQAAIGASDDYTGMRVDISVMPGKKVKRMIEHRLRQYYWDVIRWGDALNPYVNLQATRMRGGPGR